MGDNSRLRQQSALARLFGTSGPATADKTPASSSSCVCLDGNGAPGLEEALAGALGISGLDSFRGTTPSSNRQRCASADAPTSAAPAPSSALAASASERSHRTLCAAVATVEEEVDEEVLTYVDMRLRAAAHEWPTDVPPPDSAAEALDANGYWGAAARGAEIRLCEDDPAKGMGAFATRSIQAGEVVGVYWGEQLTQRQHALRHGWRTKIKAPMPTRAERQAAAERKDRLAALEAGAPIRGAANGSAYCFSLFSDELKASLGSTLLPRRIAFIDSEDPKLSSWTRYINHSPGDSPACNLESKTDGLRCLVWFEAHRDIAAGEELTFDCEMATSRCAVTALLVSCVPYVGMRSNSSFRTSFRSRASQMARLTNGTMTTMQRT